MFSITLIAFFFIFRLCALFHFWLGESKRKKKEKIFVVWILKFGSLSITQQKIKKKIKYGFQFCSLMYFIISGECLVGEKIELV